ncbi:MAG TPA: integrase zinc binding domain-containing protein, partial [Nitrososphaeraceae archaeon]|nr:integrase zinc binding domain-containing protein [Nitrososphaeraceae archaeon]
MDDENYQTIIRKIGKYPNKYKLKEGKLYRLRPNNKELLVVRRFEIEPILSLAHEHPLSGHFGVESTLTKIKERYYWPKMRNDIKSYIQTCDQCQRRGKSTDKNELYSIKIK